MGRGNWLPDTPQYKGEYNLAYVELGDCADEMDVELSYDNLWDNIQLILPKSFDRISPCDRISLGRDTVAMFANELLLVVMDCGGDYVNQGIAVVARSENPPAFADYWIDEIAEKLWKGLARCGYKLCRRNCAWTCTPFIPALSDEMEALCEKFGQLTLAEMRGKIAQAAEDEEVCEWADLFIRENVDLPERLHRINYDLRVLSDQYGKDTTLEILHQRFQPKKRKKNPQKKMALA